MSLAAATREAVRERPFLHDALRAGVVNYTAAARYLDIGEVEPVAAALRRYAEELDPAAGPGTVRVTMESGLGECSGSGEGMLRVGETAFVPGEGSFTGVLGTGDVSPTALRHVLGRCGVNDIEVHAAGVTAESVLLVVGRRDGPDAVQGMEAVFE